MSQSPPRPNLFIIGAMKSGTSSLHSYLNAHPAVFMCEPKEPCYFIHPDQLDWPDIKKLELWKSEARYLELFKAAKDEKIIGESSTLYAKLPKMTGVPARIAQFNPHARFIYVMRDPIERTISHYWHEVRRGNEYQDILTAIRENSLYRDVSHYAMQLEPFLEQFGRENILILTFEEMRADPSKFMRDVFKWLGIDETFEPPNLGEKVHVTPSKFFQKGWFFRLRYTWPWSELASLLPKKIRSAGLRIAVKEVDRSDASTDTEEIKHFLRPIQQEQTRALSKMMGRDFPEWKTLYQDL